MYRPIVAAAAAAILLAGCSSSTPAAAPSAPTSGASTATASPTVTPTQPAGTLELGDILELNGGDSTIQVQRVERWKSADRPAAFRAMVRGCNVSVTDGIAFSWTPWALASSDGSEYPASDVTMSDDPKPLYPFDGERGYKVGQCARGWVMFDVPKGDEVAVVRYANSTGDVAEWAISS